MSRTACQELFLAGHNHLDRTSGFARQVIAQRLVKDHALTTKVPTHQAGDHPHPGDRQSDNFCHEAAHPKRHLVGTPHGHAAIRADVGNGRVRLQVALVHGLSGEVMLENQFGLGKTQGSITLGERLVEKGIGVFYRGGKSRIGVKVLVDKERTFFHRLLYIGYGWQLFVLHINEA